MNKQLFEKWHPTGLLDLLEEKEQYSVAQLLENTAIYLLKKKETEKIPEEINEIIVSVLLPLIPKIFNGLSASLPYTPLRFPSDLHEGKTHTVKTMPAFSWIEVNDFIKGVGCVLSPDIEYVSILADDFNRFVKNSSLKDKHLLPYQIITIYNEYDGRIYFHLRASFKEQQ